MSTCAQACDTKTILRALGEKVARQGRAAGLSSLEEQVGREKASGMNWRVEEVSEETVEVEETSHRVEA